MKVERDRVAPPRRVILYGCTLYSLNHQQRYRHIVEIHNAGNGLYVFALSQVSEYSTVIFPSKNFRCFFVKTIGFQVFYH